MRRLIWKAAIAAILTAVGTYFAVDYAAKNPRSWIGRVVASTSQIGAKCSPLVAISGFQQQQNIVEKTTVQKTKQIEQVPQVKPALFEPIVVEFPEPVIGRFFDEVQINQGVAAVNPVNRRTVKETPMFMPYAKEDQPKCTEQEQSADRAGSRVANQRAQASWVWQGLVQVVSYFETPESTDVTPKQLDFDPLATPLQDSEKMPETPAPTAEEDPHYHHHHSGCPYFGGYRCRDRVPTPTRDTDGK